MIDVSAAEFEDLVSAALDAVPADLLDLIENAVVLVEDEPPGDQPATLLGLYEGVPLTERYDAVGMLPDRILIFRGPLTRLATSRAQLQHEVRVTVVHEIAHHFGIDDDRLQELGWG